ncbi:MAG: protein kinase family protein, partial [Aggregatilineales bacterium]
LISPTGRRRVRSIFLPNQPFLFCLNSFYRVSLPGSVSNDPLGNQAVMRMIAKRNKQTAVPMRPKTGDSTVRRVNFNNPGWATAGAVTRSGAGAEGVLFVTFATGQLIVKFLDEAAGAKFADTVLGQLNVDKPQTRFVENNDNDAEGFQIRQLVSANLNTLPNDKQQQVQGQLDNRKYIQIQTVAQATGGDRLNATQLDNVLYDPTVMRDLGKLAMVDAFLGNYDRLSHSSINTGNFMFGNADVAPTLVAIDNDAVAPKGSNKGARGGDLTFILNPSNVQALAQAFVVKMTKGGTIMPSSAAVTDIDSIISFVTNQFAEGIRAAAGEIITLIKSDPAFFSTMESTEKTNLPGPATKPRQLLRSETKERFKMLQKAYVKNGWDKLPVRW